MECNSDIYLSFDAYNPEKENDSHAVTETGVQTYDSSSKNIKTGDEMFPFVFLVAAIFLLTLLLLVNKLIHKASSFLNKKILLDI